MSTIHEALGEKTKYVRRESWAPWAYAEASRHDDGEVWSVRRRQSLPVDPLNHSVSLDEFDWLAQDWVAIDAPLVHVHRGEQGVQPASEDVLHIMAKGVRTCGYIDPSVPGEWRKVFFPKHTS